ncbi:hypothetical protein CDL60_07170 [Roseateles noduli]|nr:hypothetical protein CDL60_07170 [Roseateles noduli]
MTELPITLSPRTGTGAGLSADSDSASAPTAPAAAVPVPVLSPQVGELLALLDGGATAFVGLPGTEAIPRPARARTVVDLHAGHVGQPVLLVFEDGDRERPVVVGVVRTAQTPAASEDVARMTRAEVQTDGEHLVVTARHALTLRCGKARLTLRADGRIELRGEEILAQAIGANRLQGGSVHLN